jgi:hypothetical protein
MPWEYKYWYWYWDQQGDPMASTIQNLEQDGQEDWELVSLATHPNIYAEPGFRGPVTRGFGSWFVAVLKRPTAEG